MLANKKLIKLAQASLLTAIILLLTFTPIGYLKVFGLEITFLSIPVTVGAILLGTSYGAFLGFIFGITSFLMCFGMSPFGAVLLGINPLFCFIVCVIPRTLMGYLAGLIYKNVKDKFKTATPSLLIASFAGPFLNTLLFMTTLLICFGQSEFILSMMSELGTTNIIWFALLFVGLQGLIEAILGTVASFAVSKALYKINK